MSGTLFPDGPAKWLHTPNLKKLAARSVRFKYRYTASPLCALGRASFMSGQLPSVTGVYDNAAEFPASLSTYAQSMDLNEVEEHQRFPRNNNVIKDTI